MRWSLVKGAMSVVVEFEVPKARAITRVCVSRSVSCLQILSKLSATAMPACLSAVMSWDLKLEVSNKLFCVSNYFIHSLISTYTTGYQY